MCGIVGIYYKNNNLLDKLGTSLAAMLVQMSERGPDSAGVAVYRDPVDAAHVKVSLYAAGAYDWNSLRDQLAQRCNKAVEFERHASHALFTLPVSEFDALAWIQDEYPNLRVMSVGNSI